MKLTDHTFACSSLTNFEYEGHAKTGNWSFIYLLKFLQKNHSKGSYFWRVFWILNHRVMARNATASLRRLHYKCVKVYRGKTASFSARSFCTYVSSLDSWGLLGQDSARIYYRTAKYRVGKILVGMPIPRRFSFLGDSGNRGSSYLLLVHAWTFCLLPI